MGIKNINRYECERPGCEVFEEVSVPIEAEKKQIGHEKTKFIWEKIAVRGVFENLWCGLCIHENFGPEYVCEEDLKKMSIAFPERNIRKTFPNSPVEKDFEEIEQQIIKTEKKVQDFTSKTRQPLQALNPNGDKVTTNNL